MKKIFFIIFLGLTIQNFAQVKLDADGPGNTYELINSRFAPGFDAVEHPECVHPEFGRHIAEVWDDELKQFVFEFYSHVKPDNDRCIYFDRQRIEIKTYESSPSHLKGVVGEVVTYKWKFRLPIGFQPSSKFTHIHQIKAVGGNDGDPIFTITPRKGSPNKLELIHNNSTKVATADLSLFLGVWVECTEVIKIGSVGTYSMIINKVSDGTTLLSYNNNSIMTIRVDNSFIRPKWGIYRSLEAITDLRDEAVRFSSFSIQESSTGVAESYNVIPQTFSLEQNFPNPFNPTTSISFSIPKSIYVSVKVFDSTGKEVANLVDGFRTAGNYKINFDASKLSSGIYYCKMEAEKNIYTIKMAMIK